MPRVAVTFDLQTAEITLERHHAAMWSLHCLVVLAQTLDGGWWLETQRCEEIIETMPNKSKRFILYVMSFKMLWDRIKFSTTRSVRAILVSDIMESHGQDVRHAPCDILSCAQPGSLLLLEREYLVMGWPHVTPIRNHQPYLFNPFSKSGNGVVVLVDFGWFWILPGEIQLLNVPMRVLPRLQVG